MAAFGNGLDKANYIVEISVSARTEQRDDGSWVARNGEFGFVTYGATSDEAFEEIKTAVAMVLDTLWEKGGIEAVRGWLNRSGVPAMISDSAEPQVRRYEMRTRKELAAV